MLNLACVDRARGDAKSALAEANTAVDLLAATSGGPELSSAYCARAWARAHLGDWLRACSDIDTAASLPFAITRDEVLAEAAAIHSSYGDARDLQRLLAGVDIESGSMGAKLSAIQWFWTPLRLGRLDEAEAKLGEANERGTGGQPGDRLQMAVGRALILARKDDQQAETALEAARELARRQRSRYWLDVLSVEMACRHGHLSQTVGDLASRDPAILSVQAEPLARHLGDLTPDCARLVKGEALTRPARWAGALRQAMERGDDSTVLSAARWLDESRFAGGCPDLEKSLASTKRPASRQQSRTTTCSPARRPRLH